MSDYRGLQAVHYASIRGMETVVQTLVDRGVDVEVGGERGGVEVGGEKEDREGEGGEGREAGGTEKEGSGRSRCR